MLQQSAGPDLEDVFAPTSAQPRESITPSARPSQYHPATVSDESEAEIDDFAPARSSQYHSATLSDESEAETDDFAPSARYSQYHSATVSDESEAETDDFAPSARSSQYDSASVSDESEAETDIFTPVSQTAHAPANHPPDVPHPGLPLDPVQVAGELDVPCLTDADQGRLKNFEEALTKNNLTECPQCLIRWFTIELDRQTGVCKECTDDNAFREENPQLPALWSEANELDPGEPPEHLEALGPLTPLEEWLIA
ncbi:hypothetical protein E4U27_001053, partial [Claviceps purpurea]